MLFSFQSRSQRVIFEVFECPKVVSFDLPDFLLYVIAPSRSIGHYYVHLYVLNKLKPCGIFTRYEAVNN